MGVAGTAVVLAAGGVLINEGALIGAPGVLGTARATGGDLISEGALIGALGVLGTARVTGGDLISEGALIGALGVLGTARATCGDLISEGALIGAFGIFGGFRGGEEGGVAVEPSSNWEFISLNSLFNHVRSFWEMGFPFQVTGLDLSWAVFGPMPR